jgi:hypothetical protein
VVGLVRELDGEQLHAWFNISDSHCEIELTDGVSLRQVDGHGLVGGDMDDRRVRLPGFGVLFARPI